MKSKKQHLYDIEAEKDGVISTYSIFKKGRTFYIGDHTVHPGNRSEQGVKRELAVVFQAKFVRKIERWS